jgi:hypothetical protein
MSHYWSVSDQLLISLWAQTNSEINSINQVTLEKLCSRNTDLYADEVTLKFLLNNLSSQNSILSNALKDSLIERIK